MNTSAAFLTDLQQQSIVDKQKAELYMQMYPYVSEDFLSSWDATSYSENLSLHIDNIHAQLATLAEVLANHTHYIKPHSHGSQGGEPVMLHSQNPVESSNIRWQVVKCPTVINTTGSDWNLTGNFKTPGLPSEGQLSTGFRRAKPLPETLKVTLPPIYTAGF